MLPSANNIADSLAAWVFGSHDAYAAYATAFLQSHGLNQTHVGSDASGFDPSTTSTASDLTALGLLALKSPVLMSIAGEKSADLPVAGTVRNYDEVLGQNGITGLKTGNNDADPGAFLFTGSATIGGKTIPLAGRRHGRPGPAHGAAGWQQPEQFAAAEFRASHCGYGRPSGRQAHDRLGPIGTDHGR